MSRAAAFVRRHRAAVAVAAGVLLVCAIAGVWAGVRASARQAAPLQTLFFDYQDYLLTRPGVVSVGIGEKDGRSFIQVYVRRLTWKVKVGIPRRLGGWPVSVKVVKVRTPRPTSPSPSPSPIRTSAVSIGATGKVRAVVVLARPDAAGRLGWLLVDDTIAGDGQVRPASIAVLQSTVFYEVKGEDLLPLPDGAFGRALRGREVSVSLDEATRRNGLTQATALAVVLSE